MNNNIYIATTPYQILVSCSIANNSSWLLTCNSIVEDAVLKSMIDEVFSGKFIIIKTTQDYKANKKDIFLFRNKVREINRVLSSFEIHDIFLFNDFDPVTQQLAKQIIHRGSICVVEEGIGLYRDSIMRHRGIVKCFGKLLFGMSYEYINRIGECSAVSKIMCSSPTLLSEKQKKKTLLPLSELDYHLFQKRIKITPIKGCDWFLGQPLVEDGVLKVVDYLKIIKELSTELMKKNRKLMIKPHPREDLKKYEFTKNVCYDNKIPVELIIDNSSLVAVYSIYSSALIQLSRIRNVKAYALYKCVPDIHLTNDIDKLFLNNGVLLMENYGV